LVYIDEILDWKRYDPIPYAPKEFLQSTIANNLANILRMWIPHMLEPNLTQELMEPIEEG